MNGTKMQCITKYYQVQHDQKLNNFLFQCGLGYLQAYVISSGLQQISSSFARQDLHGS